MSKVRLGIIGFGNIGASHAKLIAEGQVPDIEITAIADGSQEMRARAVELFGNDFPVFSDGKGLIKSGKTDAVLSPFRITSTLKLPLRRSVPAFMCYVKSRQAFTQSRFAK